MEFSLIVSSHVLLFICVTRALFSRISSLITSNLFSIRFPRCRPVFTIGKQCPLQISSFSEKRHTLGLALIGILISTLDATLVISTTCKWIWNSRQCGWEDTQIHWHHHEDDHDIYYWPTHKHIYKAINVHLLRDQK